MENLHGNMHVLCFHVKIYDSTKTYSFSCVFSIASFPPPPPHCIIMVIRFYAKYVSIVLQSVIFY